MVWHCERLLRVTRHQEVARSGTALNLLRLSSSMHLVKLQSLGVMWLTMSVLVVTPLSHCEPTVVQTHAVLSHNRVQGHQRLCTTDPGL